MLNFNLKFWRIISLGMLLALLSACGFALRGSGQQAQLAPQLQTLLLRGETGNSELIRLIRRSLTSSNVNLIETTQANIHQLIVADEEISERVLSVNSNARAGEYELNMSVIVQLLINSEIGEGEGGVNGEAEESVDLFASEIFSIQRVYLADPDNAVAKTNETRLIQREMRQELANQIMRRLQSIQ